MEAFSSISGTTPSVGELSAEFAKQKRAKSPPLAFEKTPNDALVPLNSPRRSHSGTIDSAADTTMGRLSPLQSGEAQDLQVVVDQQASAIQLLHDAFAAERQAWSLEREQLYQRIASLETLLKTGGGYSPAKSPILSPMNGGSLTSPNSRAMATSHRLPSIAEDENITPLSRRRGGAPQSIDISGSSKTHQEDELSVSFEEASPSAVIVEEIPGSPPQTRALSPPPFNYRMEAGHTPLHPPRQPTPPPQNSMSMDGIEDTPTRSNTHINTYLSRSNKKEEEKELKGPLNMPELPYVPGDANFTFDMLSKKLEQIEQHPEDAKPMVFQQPSPGLASPAEKDDEFISPKTKDSDNVEAPNAPPSTRATPQDSRASERASNTLSPSNMPSLPKETSREDKMQEDFESGGIKLKKRPSVNFGAPFGSLGGFGSVRKLS